MNRHLSSPPVSIQYQSWLTDDGTFVSTLLNADCGLSQETRGLSTKEGRTFFHVSYDRDRPRSLALRRSTLGDDGKLVGEQVSESCSLSSELTGLSWLDTNRFQHTVRSSAYGGHFIISFLEGLGFTNLHLNDEHRQYETRLLGHAAWIESGPQSRTTTKQIRIRVE